ncbi:MAG: hypothetical protein JW702_11895 [Clostridiales bacterium]|nr:hypothetical protein [Clostridiales bacterium]
MAQSCNVIHKLIERYDYGGAYDIMLENGLEETDAGKIINSCRYAINFDFKTAKYNLSELNETLLNSEIIVATKKNLDELIKGNPDAIFSELMENIKIQIVNEEFIDFLGRVYRFKEAIYKFIFISSLGDKKKFSFLTDVVLKKNILRILKKKFNIYSGSTIYGISNYINKYQKNEFKYIKVDKILNADKMNEIIELRHNSIIGHGFSGVSVDDIYRAYGNPYNVLDDFEDCMNILDIKIFKYKYGQLNEVLYHLTCDLKEKNEDE